MKRCFLSLVLAVILVVGMLSIECFAVTTDSQTEIRYLDDGGYIITTIEEAGVRATDSKTGTKTNSKYNSDGSYYHDNSSSKTIHSSKYNDKRRP